MFGSSVLEMALGLVLVYAALSMVCSSLVSYVGALFKRRFTHLGDALGYFFQKGDPLGAKMLAEVLNTRDIQGLVTHLWSNFARPTPVAAAKKSEDAKLESDSPFDLRKTLQRWNLKEIPPENMADAVMTWLIGPVPVAVEAATRAAEAQDVGLPAVRLRARAQSLFEELRRTIGGLPDDGVIKGGFLSLLTREEQRLGPGLAEGVALAAAVQTLAAVLDSIRKASSDLPEGTLRTDVITRLDAVSEIVSRMRDDAEIVAALKGRAISVLTSLRESINNGVEEGVPKANLRALMIELSQAFERIDTSSTAPAQIFALAADALDRFRGVILTLSNPAQKQALLDVLDHQAAELAQYRDRLELGRRVRARLPQVPPGELRDAIVGALGASGLFLDPKMLRASILQSFNALLDRLSDWYTKNTQKIVVIVAFLVAFVGNADTLAIASKFGVSMNNNPEAFRLALARSEDIATRRKNLRGSNPSSKTSPEPAEKKDAGPSNTAGPAPPPNTVSNAPKGVSGDQPDLFFDDIRELEIPLGWDSIEFAKVQGLLNVRNGDLSRAGEGIRKVIGLLITALALSRGSQFWYDLLQNLIAWTRGEGRETSNA